MSEELQTGEVAPVETVTEVTAEAQPAENHESGSELATDSGGQHEQAASVEEDAAAKQAAANAKTQDVINKKHFQTKQAERERDEARAQVAKFEQEKRELEATQAANIPAIPDEYADDFKERLAERDAAIVRKAQFDANQTAVAKQQEYQAQQEQQKAAAEFQQAQIDYSTRSVELGIQPAELQAAGNVVAGYGLSDDLVKHIINDSDGPLITKYLAANPMDAYNLASMSVYEQGAYLNGVKDKASALKPKPSNAPTPPAQLPAGGGAQTANNRPNSAGAEFS